MTTKVIQLDIQKPNSGMVVCAKQGDKGSRLLRIALTEGEKIYTIPEGASAGFRCLKPDGHSCDNPAVIEENGMILVELTEQILAVPGDVWADLYFTGPEGQRLSSLNFRIHVEFAPVGKSIQSSNEFLTLVDMVSRGEALLEELDGAEGGLKDLRERVGALTGSQAQLSALANSTATRVAQLGIAQDILAEEVSGLTKAQETLAEEVEALKKNGVGGGSGDGSGEGGVSSWNDLTDKPFGEETLTSEYVFGEDPDPVTFDASALGLWYWKVSDLVPSRDQAMRARYHIVFPSGAFTETPAEAGVLIDTEDVLCFQLAESNVTLAVLYRAGQVSASFAGVALNLNVPEAGIYFALNQGNTPEDGRVVRVAFDEIRTLDPKFLPAEAIDARIDAYMEAALGGDY